ncbi:YciI family protein [Sphingomonas sp. HF-S4]|uniref:YciI family protein n=1 Tax=Sphingomonas agrestis TaxID=3080540 RepID=A0ABU3YCA8_9SPHN|nr:YciI family protein [Sphingomonas sp. HF-S4]MDV3459021.1 YciI family protein [Sphingomonas sp. HF-S4]
MIIVLLRYTGDVTPHRDAHVAWLREALAEGRLVTAGRQPDTGGVLIARGDRSEVEAWAAQDPYRLAGVAENTFVEFTPSMAAPGLESLLP